MAQSFIDDFTTSDTFGAHPDRLDTNFSALRSSFSGTSFPSAPTPVNGQLCWRTDRGLDVAGGGKTGRLYRYTGNTAVGENGWVVEEETSPLAAEISNARGTKLTLDQRLDVALNEDGTLKAGGSQYSSQWITPALTFTYLSTTTFKTNGNTTDIYLQYRRLKVNLNASNFFTEVVSSVYDGGQDETTITILDATLDNTLVSVEHAIISPISGNGAVSAKMIKAANRELDLSVIHNITVDADYTLTAAQNLYGRIEITDTNPFLTTGRNITFDNTEHSFIFVNSSAQTLTAKTAAGTGIAVLAGEAKELRNNGTDIVLKEMDNSLLNNTNEAQGKLGDLDLGQNISVASWSYSGTTITINTSSVHNLSVGDSFYVSGLGATTNAPNGKWMVATVVDADTITFTATSIPTGTPTVSSAILVSGITSISATEWLNDGVDIGGGETLYPDGTIYGTNALGKYTKYPNGDVTIIINDTIPYFTATALQKTLTLPLTLIDTTYSANATIASGATTTTPAETEFGEIVLRKDVATTSSLPCYIYRQANQTSWGVLDTLDVSVTIHGRWK